MRLSAMRLHTKQVADRLGVTSITVYRWLKAGKVPEPHRDRNGWRIWTEKDFKEIEAYANKTLPPATPK